MSFSREGLALIEADKPQFSELSMGLISAPMLNSERQAALRGQVGVHRPKARHANECGLPAYVAGATHVWDMHAHEVVFKASTRQQEDEEARTSQPWGPGVHSAK